MEPPSVSVPTKEPWQPPSATLRKDPAPSVASAACRALGQLKSSSSAAAVAELLQDPSPMVKAGGLDGWLDGKLFNDKSHLVRCAAVKAVAACGELGQMYASEVDKGRCGH
eukprot:Skav204915  [mRNA]  locus=scaffold1506:104246:105713:- [translate_table: standard]